MTLQELFEGDSIKLVLLGAAATLLAGGIVWVLRAVFSPRAKIIWCHHGEIIPTLAADGSNDSICIHKITIQNVGRADAKDILISTAGAVSKPKINRESVGFSLANRQLIKDDTNFSVTSMQGTDVIVVPKLPASNIVNIVYSGLDGHFVAVNSVTADGVVAAEAYREFRFLRERDIYRRTALASWWLLLPAMIPILMGLLSSLVQGLSE